MMVTQQFQNVTQPQVQIAEFAAEKRDCDSAGIRRVGRSNFRVGF